MATLARLYREQPAWRAAAAGIQEGSRCAVWFSQRPGEPWHLVREAGETWLRPGGVDRPDLVFRFTPAAIRELARAGEDIAEFAVRLFELMIDPDEERRIGFRIAAPFSRLLHGGYVRVLLDAGPQVASFAASHGVHDLASLHDLVRWLARAAPFAWERSSANHDRTD